jgi:hypothetical protein
MSFFSDFQTRGASYDHNIRRIGKDGSVTEVVMNDKDYPAPPPGEKLSWLVGAGKPYTFTSKDQNTGEPTQVEFIDLEFQVISGPAKGNLYLIGVSTKVSDRSNLGKISLATQGALNLNVPDLLAKALRKPVYIYTNNESRGDWTRVKFVSARPYDELVDGPIGGQAAPAPQPAAVAASDDGAALFDVEL